MVVQQISTRINDAVVYRYSKLFETIVYISSSIHTWQIFLCLLCHLLLDCLKLSPDCFRHTSKLLNMDNVDQFKHAFLAGQDALQSHSSKTTME